MVAGGRPGCASILAVAAAKGFEVELAAVNAAGEPGPEEALPLLRKAVAHRSNVIVSRPAKHAARLNLAKFSGCCFIKLSRCGMLVRYVGALRGTCALALVQCREVSSFRPLRWLTPLLWLLFFVVSFLDTVKRVVGCAACSVFDIFAP